MDSWRTWLLLGTVTALTAAVGGLFAGLPGAIVGTGFGLTLFGLAYWYSDRIALRSSGAVPLSESDAADLYVITRTLCRRADLTVPELYIIDSAHPNAFATGRNARRAAIAVTQGLLDSLERSEIEGVIAHELAHIKNHDIVMSSVAAALAGTLTSLSTSRNHVGVRRAWRIALLYLLAPLAALFIRLTVPQNRDFLADETASRMVATPLGLIRALQKMADRTPGTVDVNPATAHLYTWQPLMDERLGLLFRVNPSVEERIRRLETVA